MKHKITIAGSEVELEWTQGTQRQLEYRMSEIGGAPTTAQLRNPKTSVSAWFKILWGLLPKSEIIKYPDPEALFISVDQETESEGILNALIAINKESTQVETPQKKRSARK
jgi:hypothetical protein